MPTNKGKTWEQIIKKAWLESHPKGFIYRLPDQVSGYTNSKNVADFIAYNRGNLFLIEAKTTKENTWSITNFRQYDNLKKYAGRYVDGIYAGVMLWFTKHQKAYWIPIETIVKLKEAGEKSINIKYWQYPKINAPEEDSYYIKNFPMYELDVTPLRTNVKLKFADDPRIDIPNSYCYNINKGWISWC